MVLERDAVDRRLDCRVEQLDDQHQDQAADEQRALDAGVAQPERERREQGDQDQLLAEGVFVPGGGGEPGERILRRVQDPAKARFPLVRVFF